MTAPWPRTQTQRIHYRKHKRDWFAENPAKRKAYNRRYYAANVERLRAEAKAKREANRIQIRDYNREYRRNNPGCDAAWRLKRKLRRAWLKWTQVMAANRPLEAQ